ncbi:MAG TPA: low molecular weight phosphatase family protein [Lichenihabitans sp.]|nr:low molecular weight phosphatase family protein [Lichenihabitans sp.]
MLRPRPQSLLFACSENAVRSPMAEALARQWFGRAMHLTSAGVRPGERDPFVTAVMDEVGIDLSRHRPRRFEDLEDDSFDAIISLSPEAHHRALEYTRTMAVDVIYWPTFDPTATEGSRNTVLDAYRGVRDHLLARIRREFDWRPTGAV